MGEAIAKRFAAEGGIVIGIDRQSHNILPGSAFFKSQTTPDLAVKVGFNKADLDYGHPIKRVDGEHDLFGDGSVVTLPTPGHTPGHQSLKVRTDKAEVVLTGDACYFCRTLRERRLPAARFIYDRDAMIASLNRLEELEQGGAKLIFGHDWDFWQTLPNAPAPVV